MITLMLRAKQTHTAVGISSARLNSKQYGFSLVLHGHERLEHVHFGRDLATTLRWLFEGHAPSGRRGGSRQAGAQSDIRKVRRCDNRRGS